MVVLVKLFSKSAYRQKKKRVFSQSQFSFHSTKPSEIPESLADGGAFA